MVALVSSKAILLPDVVPETEVLSFTSVSSFYLDFGSTCQIEVESNTWRKMETFF